MPNVVVDSAAIWSHAGEKQRACEVAGEVAL